MRRHLRILSVRHSGLQRLFQRLLRVVLCILWRQLHRMFRVLLRLRVNLRRVVRVCLCGRVLFQLYGYLWGELFHSLFGVLLVLHELLCKGL